MTATVTKLRFAGASIRRKSKPKSKSPKKIGRPRRKEPSQFWLKIARSWLPSALAGEPYILPAMRGMIDDLAIAEEANKFLVATRKDLSREDRTNHIADWLSMDRKKLANWFARPKRAR